MQYTLTNSIIFKGVGLHSGQNVSMKITPAGADEGIRFIREDIDHANNVIPARFDLVEESQLCTRLKNENGVTISTIEHVMAALVGCGIDNATIIIDGPECPIMDGSSLPFVEKFMAVGIEGINAPRQAIKILKPVTVQGNDGSYARIMPDTQSVFDFTIEFDNRFIGRQHLEFTLSDHTAFSSELADCPTFTTVDQVEQLKAMGLIKGGSEKNADVYADDAIYRDTSRPRKEDAAVRHKLLDMVGDCGLAGAPIIGRIETFKGGHALTNQLLRALFADKSAFMLIEDHLGIAQADDGTESASLKIAHNA